MENEQEEKNKEFLLLYYKSFNRLLTISTKSVEMTI